MSTAAIVGGSIAAAGIGAATSMKAGSTQANAANQAAQLQHQDAQASLAFQEQQYNTQQKNLAPWLQAGGQAENQLSSLLGTPGQGLLQNWNQQFQAPTDVTEQNDPGYQFRLKQGMDALQNSASARGNLLSGGTAKAITQYGQDYASNEYQNVYNRAYNEYSTNYNQFQQGQANTFNRLSSLAGGGQVAANTLGQLGQQASQNVSNINLTSGAQIGQDYQNAGAANASGYVGAGNAATGALGNISQYLLLKGLLG